MITTLSYEQRAEHISHPLAKQLLSLMAIKKTNLALAADVTTSDQLLTLADKLGPEICVLKTHIDILDDFSIPMVKELQYLAKQHQFLIFEDRKFADIGNAVKHQYQDGLYKIVKWADIVNAHGIPDSGVVAGLKEVGIPYQRGCLLIAQMSGSNTLFTEQYTEATIKMAQEHPDFVIGFIAQQRLIDVPDFIYMTPGVNLAQTGDKLGQTYIDPNTAICKNGSDIIIVGRAITQAEDPVKMAQVFRHAGWDAYNERQQK
ncbi:MAG: orotidine-5'-phosphate decarboxylase [Gammaproteobacteria bacterium]